VRDPLHAIYQAMELAPNTSWLQLIPKWYTVVLDYIVVDVMFISFLSSMAMYVQL